MQFSSQRAGGNGSCQSYYRGTCFFSFLKTRTLQLATAVPLPFPSMLMSSTAFLVCLLLSRNQAGESAKC